MAGLMKKSISFFMFCFILSNTAFAEMLNIAVASNFAPALNKLAADFSMQTGHQLRISNASTGNLYTQIKHGAPFDVYLAADEKHPDLLVSERLAEAASAYVYAKGQIVLVSNIVPADTCQSVLWSNELQHLSIANPATAPYGLAAKQVLESLSLWSKLKTRLVIGENIAQAFQFVYTKNAQAGFVASSMLKLDKEINSVCIWNVPVDMYSPIKQKMVVLSQAKDKVSAQAFQKYMRSLRAKEIIKSSGYDVTP